MGAIVTLIVCMTIVFMQLVVTESHDYVWFPIIVIGTLLCYLGQVLQVSEKVGLAKHAAANASATEEKPLTKAQKIIKIAMPIVAGGGLVLATSIAGYFGFSSSAMADDAAAITDALDEANMRLMDNGLEMVEVDWE